MNHDDDGPMEELVNGNAKFVRSRKYKKERSNLVNEQHPGVVIVCCSDSRVPPEIVFQRIKLGELFVVRTAGHVLDKVSIESIDFAIKYLNCHYIIVLGHEKCGAVSLVHNMSALSTGTGQGTSSIKDYISRNLSDSVENSIRLNSIMTANLICQHIDIDEQYVYPALYHIDSGRVEFL